MTTKTSITEMEDWMPCTSSSRIIRIGLFPEVQELGKAKESRLKGRAKVAKMAKAKARRAVSQVPRKNFAPTALTASGCILASATVADTTTTRLAIIKRPYPKPLKTEAGKIRELARARAAKARARTREKVRKVVKVKVNATCAGNFEKSTNGRQLLVTSTVKGRG
jgi:hypothetical protein